jgi:hypothetical protein
VGRGSAFADIDGDGDLDILLTAVGGQPRLLRNDQKSGHRWLRFELTGTRVNRDAIGAWVEVQVGEQRIRRQIMPTRSYLSQSELPVTIGLGPATHVDAAQVVWPDGSIQPLSIDRLDTVVRIAQP